jgi:hypothetical protein
MFIRGEKDRAPIVFKKATGASGPHAYEKLSRFLDEAEAKSVADAAGK